MEDKFAENLALLICLTKRIEIVSREMQKVCTEMLEISQPQVSPLAPEDYD